MLADLDDDDNEEDLEDESWYENPRPSRNAPREAASPTQSPGPVNLGRRPRRGRRPCRACTRRRGRRRRSTPVPYLRDTRSSMSWISRPPYQAKDSCSKWRRAIAKRDGEWSKPKGRRFALNEIALLPDPADRQALAILAGGREQVTGYYASHGYYDTTPARYLLTHALSEALLPILCGTGRCLVRESEPEDSMRPLRWDDAGPWEFWLR